MFTLPYFRLTDQEHSSLQKRLHQSSAYVFGNLRLVRELENLGRGWSAFVRAQEQAKKDGILPAFQLQLKAELDETVRMGTAYNKVLGAKQRLDEHDNPLPPSAVSMRAAETGSTQLLKQGEKRKGIKASELGQLDTGDNNGASSGDEYGDPEPPPKRRGRPRGSKNKIYISGAPSQESLRPRRHQARPDYTMKEIHEVAQSSSAPIVELPRSSLPTPRKVYESLEPQFVEFPCEWKDCKARLINLATLKKHISVVHFKETHKGLRCKWGKCSKLLTPVFFYKLSDLESHVRERHIEEVAWSLGDGIGGVAGGLVAPVPPKCLPLHSLRQGVQITRSGEERKLDLRAESPTGPLRMKNMVGDDYDDENDTGSEYLNDEDREAILAY